MAIINEAWPRDLIPTTCTFTRSRNDIRQTSPATRKSTVIRRGRPLWGAELSWTMGNGDKLAKLRYYLEALDGFAGSVQLWDFASPYPYGVTGITGNFQSAMFWTYNGTLAPWAFGSIPSHWIYSNTQPTLSSGASLGATSIALTGLTASAIAAVQGQYVQIGRRLYLVAADAVANGAGAATVTITPGLLAAASSGAECRFVEAKCEMELITQEWPQRASATDHLVTVSASFLETVQDKS